MTTKGTNIKKVKAKRLPTVEIECRKSEANKKGAPLYIRITIDRRPRYISLKERINPNDFDFNKKKMKQGNYKNLDINDYITDEKRKVDEIIKRLHNSDKPISFENIKELYLIGENRDFIKFVEEQISDEKKYKMFTKQTIKSHEDFLIRLKEFKSSISINHIDVKFYEKFQGYLKVERNNGVNRIKVQLKNFKKYLNNAAKLGLIDMNPLAGLDHQFIIVDKEYLNFDELAKLHNIYLNEELLSLPYGRLKQDCLQQFLIGVYTGLRYSDVAQLRKSKHLRNGRINIGKMLKTQKPVYIEIRKRLSEVLTINEECDLLYNSAIKCNLTVNNNLKRIMEYAKIEKNITFHCARHTFAILSLHLKIPMEVVSDILGHSSIDFTKKHYAKIVDGVRELHMNKWDLETDAFNVDRPKAINMIEKENEALKKRIAELEALLYKQPVMQVAR
ncbi:site-specific integrase [Carboxylicivirga marina]|uniref:site-specific integrase n=1 Tax=Carboxylicivirga marina TaxID=2800988 RepID=UPI002599EDC4|nr:site-specific integrase [uncultured Carboxylicivirga sp.]